MVLTVTCNPALDYRLAVPRLLAGETNRATETQLRAGGKGLNVSRMLAAFGADTRAVSFSAGDTGSMLEAMLAAEPFPAEWIRLPRGRTRINVKLSDGTETEINAPGAPVPEEAFGVLAARVSRLQAGDSEPAAPAPRPSSRAGFRSPRHAPAPAGPRAPAAAPAGA